MDALLDTVSNCSTNSERNPAQEPLYRGLQCIHSTSPTRHIILVSVTISCDNSQSQVHELRDSC